MIYFQKRSDFSDNFLLCGSLSDDMLTIIISSQYSFQTDQYKRGSVPLESLHLQKSVRPKHKYCSAFLFIKTKTKNNKIIKMNKFALIFVAAAMIASAVGAPRTRRAVGM